VPGARFHDGQHGSTHAVRVLLFGHELRIVGADDATLAAWPTGRIRAAPEIDPDGAVALTARGLPGVLLVDDSAELEILRRSGIRLPGCSVWTRGRWLAVGAGLLGALAIASLTVNALPRWIAAAIPLAWEQRLGVAAAAVITNQRGRCGGAKGESPEGQTVEGQTVKDHTAAAGQAALDRFVGRLREAGGIATPVTIGVLDDPTINAFTLPGGHVLVMRGLIGAATDGPMLAGIIAHELGHVAHRDPTTMLIRGLEFSLLLNAIGIGDAGGVAAGATHLTNLASSRAAEAAADASALDFLTLAGLRADGLSRFFALMEQRETGSAGNRLKPGSGTMQTWLATHPSEASRRERTARPETGDMPFTQAEWQAIRTMCASG
jgi:Zn-dependent protease with chaperone function